MADTIVLTGVISDEAIVLNGQTGAQQVTVTGTVAQRGPTGPAGESGVWGSISGTLSSQYDLQSALDSKQGKAHIIVGPTGDTGYTTDGTDDQVQIQAAIDAVSNGTVELQRGTYSVSAGISWDKDSVTLKGQGVGSTKIVATAASFDIITIGNRQSSGTMRNFNHVEDMTVTMAGGASTKACIKIDGGGRGTSIKNVQTNEGAYGLQLIDLDRCFFENIDVNNVRTTAIYLQQGQENTFGTVTFLNCSMNLSDNSSVCMEFGNTAAQASPNTFDRIALINNLFYATAGLTGTKGILFTVGATALSVISSLFENTMTHVNIKSESQLTFIGDSFIQNSGVSTNAFLLENANHRLTVQDCRFQALTNVFNGSTGYSQINFIGRNNNQGSITNIFTGNFGLRQGNDTGFAGNGALYLGTDNERFENVFTNQLRIHNFTPTSGKVWTATDTDGNGSWQAVYAPGGTDVAVADGGTGASTASAARTNLGLAIGTNVQAWDADLDTWATKTAPSGTVVGTSDAQTLTSKRVTPRVSTTTSSATPTINTDNTDVYGLTALAVDVTSFTTNLSGTPTDSQKLWIYIVGTATRNITWGASFENGASNLPTATSGTTRLDIYFVWNAATSKWRCMASSVSSGSGTLTGPASSTDNALVRWDGTTGLVTQDSTATLSDTGDLTATTGAFSVTGSGSGTPITATMDSSVATNPAILAKNNTNFAQTGPLIKGILFNATDTGAALRLENSGTGKNISSANNTTETFYVAKDGTTYIATSIELGNASDTTLSRSAAGVLAVEGVVVPTISSSNTFTNKRITKRTNTTTSSATPTINTDTTDEFTITALAANITSMTTNLSGTPNNGDELMIRFKDNGTARTITWGASFTSSGVATLLATTVINKTHYVKLRYDSTAAKWVCMAVDATGY